MADHAYRLALLEEPVYEAHSLLVAAESIRPNGAARHDQGVVVVRRDLGEGLLYRESFARVDIAVHGLSLASFDADDINAGAGVLDGLLRLGELNLLGACRSEKYGYLASLQFVRHINLHLKRLLTIIMLGYPMTAYAKQCLSPTNVLFAGKKQFVAVAGS